ncbi:hypothetical protein LTR65_009068 [Meristemomyces frigidus]
MVLEVLLDSNPWMHDAEAIEMPWRQDKYDDIVARTHNSGRPDGRLVFGLLTCDEFVQPHPTVSKALQITRQALEQQGYEIVDWQPPAQNEAVDNLFRIFGATSGLSIREAMEASDEPPIPQIKEWYEQGNVEGLSAAEFWELCYARTEYRKRFADYWRNMSERTRCGRAIDGVIQPVSATTAVREGESHYYGYSAVANVLDLPAAAFPVQVESDQVDDSLPQGKPLSDVDKVVRSCCMSNNLHPTPILLRTYLCMAQIDRMMQGACLLGCKSWASDIMKNEF